MQWSEVIGFCFPAALNGQAPLGAVFYFSSPAAGELTIPLRECNLARSSHAALLAIPGSITEQDLHMCARYAHPTTHLPQLQAPSSRELMRQLCMCPE